MGRHKLPSATSEAGSLSTAPRAPSQNLPDRVRKLVAVTDTGLGSCPALCQQRRTEMQLCEGGQDPGSRQAAQQPQRFDEGAASTPPRRGTPGRGSRDVPRAGCPAAHCAAAVGRDGGPDSAQPAWPEEPGSEAWMSRGLAETPSLLRPAPSPAPWEWGVGALTCGGQGEAFAPCAVGVSSHLLLQGGRGLPGLRHGAGGASLRGEGAPSAERGPAGECRVTGHRPQGVPRARGREDT